LEIIAAIIGVLGVIVGFLLSDYRARKEHRAQQISMLIETLRNLSGTPEQVVTGTSIAIKYHKRNSDFHDLLIPVLFSISLVLSTKEKEESVLSRSEMYALYSVWCVIGSIWLFRYNRSIDRIEEAYPEFHKVERLYMETSVGKICGMFAMKKDFSWIDSAFPNE